MTRFVLVMECGNEALAPAIGRTVALALDRVSDFIREDGTAALMENPEGRLHGLPAGATCTWRFEREVAP